MPVLFNPVDFSLGFPERSQGEIINRPTTYSRKDLESAGTNATNAFPGCVVQNNDEYHCLLNSIVSSGHSDSPVNQAFRYTSNQDRHGQDCLNLYPQIEIMEGKEVVTLSKSNTVSVSNSGCIVPAERQRTKYTFSSSSSSTDCGNITWSNNTPRGCYSVPDRNPDATCSQTDLSNDFCKTNWINAPVETFSRSMHIISNSRRDKPLDLDPGEPIYIKRQEGTKTYVNSFEHGSVTTGSSRMIPTEVIGAGNILLTPQNFTSELLYSNNHAIRTDLDLSQSCSSQGSNQETGPVEPCVSAASCYVRLSGVNWEHKEQDDSSNPDDLLTPDIIAQLWYEKELKESGYKGLLPLSFTIPECKRSDYDYFTEDDAEDEVDQELVALDPPDDEDEEGSKDAEEQSENKPDYCSCLSDQFPPIGVFWDIENCQVPRGLSATHVVQAMRSRFFVGQREAEFMCVCDTLKEHSKILEELNDAQVNVVHVGSTVKNAADDKLLQSMRRFADIHGPGATIVLISGDSNFATELYDLRYRKNLRVVLVHNAHAQDSLKLCAHEAVLFTEVIQELPQRSVKAKSHSLRRDIVVHNLPEEMEESSIRRRLNMLSDNCGGKVGRVRNSTAVVHFQTPELAARAKKRLDGEDVYGNKIYCTFGKNIDKEESPKVDLNNRYNHPISHKRLQESLESCNLTEDFREFPYSSQSSNMGEVGATGLPWRVRDPVVDSSVHQPYSAFKSYTKNSVIPYSTEQQANSNQRLWRNSCRPQSPTVSSSLNSSFPGLSRVDYTANDSRDQTSPQPLYLDKTPEQFKKGRSQRVHFRVSSPPTFSVNSRTPDSYALDASVRTKSPSPLLWSNSSPVKQTWSPAQSMDLHLQGPVMYGIRELSVGDLSSADSNLAGLQQIPVELQVSNLDQNIDAREMKRILFTIFRDHVMVLHVSVFVQSDGNLAATLRVPSPQDAQYAISQLHRKKIGAKRIIISYVNHNQPSPELKRSKVIALLQEVPGKKLPLFKFRELYERRFYETIGVSEMYNMRDVVTVSDNTMGRMVALHPEFRHMNSPVLTESAQEEVSGSISSRYCKIHSSPPDESLGWAERDQSSSVPSVYLSLRTLATGIHSLLQSHSGSLPLASLVDCYRAEIGPLEDEEGGVPLEHLVSCLPGVCIVTTTGGIKYVKWLEKKVTDEAEELARCVSPPLVGQLSLFSRELVDLLKTFPQCRLPFSRFIPAYHHHFGRQCRVADYGFTKLADLFDSLSHIVHVLGEGNRRSLTLAHKAQIKRFSSDLLRVLKGQPSKSITLDCFPCAYEKALTKPWSVVDYGVCDVEDLLTEVGETTVIVTRTGTETTIAIPKREQTPEEIERTRQFATEVVELLRHSPQCKMQFNRFIPAYHHHFGRQCRVADYGFSKLIELFEAIPDCLQVFDDEEDGEKQLQLVERERVKVLGDQVGAVVRGAPRQAIKISALAQVFTRYYGYSLKPDHYGSSSFEDLMGKLRNRVKLVDTGDEPVVTLVDRGYVHDVMIRARTLLWDYPSCSLPVDNFVQAYSERFQQAPNLEVIRKDLKDVLVIEGEENAVIRLVPIQIFARELMTLLLEAGGRMLLLNFDTAYLDRFGVACRPASYGFPTIVALVQALGDLVAVRGRGTKRILVLNRENSQSPVFTNSVASSMYTVAAETTNDIGDNRIMSNPQPPPPHKLPPPQYECHQFMQGDANTNSTLLMGMNPQPQAYQQSSQVVYPSSPIPTNGSVMWSQMWSPQYPVMPPLSPAHYMVPTIPVSWGSMPNSPVGPLGSTPPPAPLVNTMAPPISIHMLDELSKQPTNKVNEEFLVPPNPSELPSPELLTQTSSVQNCLISSTASVPVDNLQQGVRNLGCGEEEAEDAWSSCPSDQEKVECANTSTPTAPKQRAKRRLAAQFTSN